MKVKMLTKGKHNGKPFKAGSEVNLSDKEAEALIARRLAEPIDEAEAGSERAELLAKAEALGLKLAKNIGMEKLRAAIDEAEAGNKGGE